MATEYLVGNDGAADFGSLGYAHISTWSATFARTSTAISGFSDTVARRRLGVLDATGSAGGHMIYNAGNNTPTGHLIAGTDASDASNIMDGQNIALYVNDTDNTANPVKTGGSQVAGVCGYNITAVFNQIGVSVDKNGDSTVTFNWEASGSIVEVWDES